MPASGVDLASVFNAVTKAIVGNQASLNEADTYNHDHGDNMVKNFKVISKAMKKKKGAAPSEQLAYASEVLSQSSSSGSARLYAQGLAQAAAQLQGQRAVNSQNAMSLVQALMGSGQAAQSSQPTPTNTTGHLSGALLGGGIPAPHSSQPAQSQSSDPLGGIMGAMLGGGASAPQAAQPAESQSSDMLGGLMGALLGGGGSAPQVSQPAEPQSSDMLGGLMGALLGGGASAPQVSQPSQPQSSDMLGGLIGALLGGGAAETSSQPKPGSQAAGGGFDLSPLLTAGAAYMQAYQQGASPMEAIIQAVMAGSQMNNSAHHSQSGQLVTSTLIGAIGSMLGGKTGRKRKS